MIDYVYADITSHYEQLRKNPLISFEDLVDIETGEICPLRDNSGRIIRKRNGDPVYQKSVAKYKDLEIIVKPSGNVYLSGSLHKYYNIITKGINQNYNDFTYNDLIISLKKLSEELLLDLNDTELIRFEFGVNINTPFPASEFLKNRVLEYKRKQATQLKTNFQNKYGHSSTGFLLEFKFTKFLIKFYAKGLQYGLNDNILRFEINTLTKYLGPKIRINTISDLFNKNILNELGYKLIEDSGQVLIRDWLNEEILSESDQKLVRFFRDPVTRSNLHRQDRHLYKREKRKYIELSQKYDTFTSKNLCQLISKKIRDLLV